MTLHSSKYTIAEVIIFQKTFYAETSADLQHYQSFRWGGVRSRKPVEI